MGFFSLFVSLCVSVNLPAKSLWGLAGENRLAPRLTSRALSISELTTSEFLKTASMVQNSIGHKSRSFSFFTLFFFWILNFFNDRKETGSERNKSERAKNKYRVRFCNEQKRIKCEEESD